jgi:predicted nucleic acid-binding protein
MPWAPRLSEPHRPPRAVLDTDIIYSRVLHELMGRVAARLRLLDLFWSEELLTETRKTLVETKGLASGIAQRWVDYLPQNFPAGRMAVDEVLSAIDLSNLTTDPGDPHVCALAMAAKADFLFTHERGYLRDGLREHGIEVAAPNVFLHLAFESQPQGMIDIIELQAATWAGGRPVEICSPRLSARELPSAPATYATGPASRVLRSPGTYSEFG